MGGEEAALSLRRLSGENLLPVFSIPKSGGIELHMAVNLSFLAKNKQQPANKKTIRLSLQNPSNVLKYKIAKFVM